MKLIIDHDYFKDVCKSFSENAQPVNGPLWAFHAGSLEPRSVIVFLALWAKIRKFTAYPFRLVMLFQEGPVINFTESNQHQILFDNETDYKDFIEFFDSFKDKTSIFNPLPDGLYKNVVAVKFDMGAYDSGMDYSTMESGRRVGAKEVDLYVWLRENCKAPYYRYGGLFSFESQSDAVYFKTTWSGRFDEK